MGKVNEKWDGRSRGGGFGYLFFVYLIKWCGIRAAYTFLALVVVYFIPFAPKATAAVWSYHRRQLGQSRLKSMSETYLHYYRFGQVLIDKIAMIEGMQNRYRFCFDRYERFLEIINGNTGVVMIGAHVGCWEAGNAFFGKYAGKINIVMFDGEHQNIKKVLERQSDERRFKIIAVNKGSIEAMLQIKIALNNGEYVCFNGDRYVNRENVRNVDFMGTPALFPGGPFLIASRCRVPVVFYYAMREKGRTYRFIFREADGTGGEESLMEQYVRSLESVLKKYPRQWFNFYKFWDN